MKTINVKQHYVPQFYLKNFGETLSAFDKITEEKFRTIPKNIAMEKNFYGGELEGLPSLEEALSSLEGHFATALRELIQKGDYQSITDESKIKIHNFLALQYLRTPSHRKEIAENYNHMLNEITKAHGIEDHTVRLAKKGEIGAHLQSIQDYPLFGMLIGHMKFTTMVNKTPIPFWTSDSPVCFDNFVPSSMGNLGIINTGIQIHLPINPKLMLIALDPVFFADYPSKMELYKKQGALFENFLQVENSSRWIFSNTRKFHEIKDMIKKYPQLKNPKRERTEKISGTLKNSDVMGFARHSSRTPILPQGGISTWMPLEQYEQIKKFYDETSKANKSKAKNNESSKSKNEFSSQDKNLQDSEEES